MVGQIIPVQCTFRIILNRFQQSVRSIVFPLSVLLTVNQVSYSLELVVAVKILPEPLLLSRRVCVSEGSEVSVIIIGCGKHYLLAVNPDNPGFSDAVQEFPGLVEGLESLFIFVCPFGDIFLP